MGGADPWGTGVALALAGGNMARNMERSETTINPTLQSTPSSPQVPGLEYERFFSTEGVDPFDEMAWALCE